MGEFAALIEIAHKQTYESIVHLILNAEFIFVLIEECLNIRFHVSKNSLLQFITVFFAKLDISKDMIADTFKVFSLHTFFRLCKGAKVS